jgi:Flp pilus assembly protein TadG
MKRIGCTSRQRGAVAVELAFVAIFLALMSAAVIEYARAMYTYNLLAKAARDGARFLSGFDPTAGADYPTAAAINRVVWGRSDTGTDADRIVPGLDPSMVRVCDRAHTAGCPPMTVATGTGSINLVRVEISGYTFTPVFPLVTGLGSITFEPISATMRQVL